MSEQHQPGVRAGAPTGARADADAGAPPGDAGVRLDHDNPWPGLASFQEGQSEFFRGRGEESRELATLVSREALTVLFGRSGLGKTSLLQAGVFPLLRDEDCFPIYIRLDHEAGTPALAEQVFSAIDRARSSGELEAPAREPGEGLWQYFHRKDRRFWNKRSRLVSLVLAFDQFEEIFTRGEESPESVERGRAFLRDLADLVEGQTPAALRERWKTDRADVTNYQFDEVDVRVLLSLREDFLPQLERCKTLMPSLLRSRMEVRPMDGRQAMTVVCDAAPGLVERGDAEKIVRFVAGADDRTLEMLRIEPALLSLMCRELNEERKRRGLAKITADQVAGSREEILQRFYEDCVRDLSPRARAYLEDQLLTASGFRASLAMDDARAEGVLDDRAIRTLVDRRLLRIDDRGDVPRIELTHDVLCRPVRASRDVRQERERAARAEEEARAAKATLAETQARARQRRTLAIVTSAAGIALVVLPVFGYLWWRARSQGIAAAKSAEEAQTANREVARLLKQEQDRAQLTMASLAEQRRTAARTEEFRKPPLQPGAPLLLLDAQDPTRTDPLANLLRSVTLPGVAQVEYQWVVPGRVVQVAWTRSGEVLLSLSDDGRLSALDRAAGATPRILAQGVRGFGITPANSAAGTPEVFALMGDTLRAIDPRTGPSEWQFACAAHAQAAQQAPPEPPAGAMFFSPLAFGPGGERVSFLDSTGRVRVVELASTETSKPRECTPPVAIPSDTLTPQRLIRMVMPMSSRAIVCWYDTDSLDGSPSESTSGAVVVNEADTDASKPWEVGPPEHQVHWLSAPTPFNRVVYAFAKDRSFMLIEPGKEGTPLTLPTGVAPDRAIPSTAGRVLLVRQRSGDATTKLRVMIADAPASTWAAFGELRTRQTIVQPGAFQDGALSPDESTCVVASLLRDGTAPPRSLLRAWSIDASPSDGYPHSSPLVVDPTSGAVLSAESTQPSEWTPLPTSHLARTGTSELTPAQPHASSSTNTSDEATPLPLRPLAHAAGSRVLTLPMGAPWAGVLEGGSLRLLDRTTGKPLDGGAELSADNASSTSFVTTNLCASPGGTFAAYNDPTSDQVLVVRVHQADGVWHSTQHAVLSAVEPLLPVAFSSDAHWLLLSGSESAYLAEIAPAGDTAKDAASNSANDSATNSANNSANNFLSTQASAVTSSEPVAIFRSPLGRITAAHTLADGTSLITIEDPRIGVATHRSFLIRPQAPIATDCGLQLAGDGKTAVVRAEDARIPGSPSGSMDDAARQRVAYAQVLGAREDAALATEHEIISRVLGGDSGAASGEPAPVRLSRPAPADRPLAQWRAELLAQLQQDHAELGAMAANPLLADYAPARAWLVKWRWLEPLLNNPTREALDTVDHPFTGTDLVALTSGLAAARYRELHADEPLTNVDRSSAEDLLRLLAKSATGDMGQSRAFAVAREFRSLRLLSTTEAYIALADSISEFAVPEDLLPASNLASRLKIDLGAATPDDLPGVMDRAEKLRDNQSLDAEARLAAGATLASFCAETESLAAKSPIAMRATIALADKLVAAGTLTHADAIRALEDAGPVSDETRAHLTPVENLLTSAQEASTSAESEFGDAAFVPRARCEAFLAELERRTGKLTCEAWLLRAENARAWVTTAAVMADADAQQTTKLFDRAADLYAKGIKACAKDASSAKLLLFQGLLFFSRAEWDATPEDQKAQLRTQGTNSLRAACERNPTGDSAPRTLAEKLMEAGQPAEAIKTWADALQRTRQAGAWEQFTALALHQSEYGPPALSARAAAPLREALQHQPKVAEPPPDAAPDVVQAATAARDTQADLRVKAGIAIASAGDWATALPLLEDGVRAMSDSSSIQRDWFGAQAVSVALSSRSPAEAVRLAEAFGKASKNQSVTAYVEAFKGAAAAQRGDKEAMAKAFAAARAAPGAENVLAFIARVHLATGDAQNAKRAYDLCVTVDGRPTPSDKLAYARILNALHATDTSDAARAVLDASSGIDAQANVAGAAHVLLGERAEAEASLLASAKVSGPAPQLFELAARVALMAPQAGNAPGATPAAPDAVSCALARLWLVESLGVYPGFLDGSLGGLFLEQDASLAPAFAGVEGEALLRAIRLPATDKNRAAGLRACKDACEKTLAPARALRAAATDKPHPALALEARLHDALKAWE